MMKLADVDGHMPSNKVIAFAAVTLIYHHFSDGVIPLEVAEAYGVFIQVGLAALTAYMVPDRPNIPRA